MFLLDYRTCSSNTGLFLINTWGSSRRCTHFYKGISNFDSQNATFYGVLLFRCLCVSRYGFPSSFFLLRGIVLKFCHLALLVFLNQPVYFRTAQQPWSIDIFIKSAIGQKWYCVPPGDDILRQKTPEMNELGSQVSNACLKIKIG